VLIIAMANRKRSAAIISTGLFGGVDLAINVPRFPVPKFAQRPTALGDVRKNV